MSTVCLGAVQLTHTSFRPEQRGGCRCTAMGRLTAGHHRSLRGWGHLVLHCPDTAGHPRSLRGWGHLVHQCTDPSSAGERRWILEQGRRIPQLVLGRAGWPQVGSWLADAFASQDCLSCGGCHPLCGGCHPLCSGCVKASPSPRLLLTLARLCSCHAIGHPVLMTHATSAAL